MPAIKNTLNNIRKNLTSLDNQPLGKAALTVILLLDFFILGSIFDGLSRHTAQLTHPNEHVPGFCREILIEEKWSKADRLERLSRLVAAHATSVYLPVERKRETHSICRPLADNLNAIKGDAELIKAIQTIQRLSREAQTLRSQHERSKGAYDTAMLETIARQPEQGRARVESLQREIAAKTAALDDTTRRIAEIEASLGQNERLQRFWTLMDGISEADRQQIRDDLRALNFWYPVKRLGMELIFLLPLLAAFYFWNSASLRNHRPAQTLVSSHLLVVAVIPVLFKVAELIYDIIPRKLLQSLIEFLESLKLIALWHYLMIALAVAAALVLLYIFQKKLFSREKLLQRRIAKGQCQQCGQSLPAGSLACPFCGFAQLKTCAHCNKPTFVYGKFCRECGRA